LSRGFASLDAVRLALNMPQTSVSRFEFHTHFLMGGQGHQGMPQSKNPSSHNGLLGFLEQYEAS
jgi:hypothetical protein